ncbi:MAG: DUF4838 domain-containing protein [Acidobacteria bacterium]|nr:DUF4838 domain-containing protein [Acidobacteriota bacterium]
MKSQTKITRLEFLKGSGLVAAGFSFLPQAVLAQAKQSQKKVSMRRLEEYQIVVPSQASPVEQQAAEKLQHYVAEMSHKNLALKSEGEYRSGPAFFIGQTQYAKTRNTDFKQLKEDGFAFRPAGDNLIVAGGTGKGVLYGVYGLLELWGFRMYTSKAIDVPTSGAVGIPRDELVVVPAVQYRTTSYPDTRAPEYTNWHRLSSRDDWGLFVHTFNELVSPDRYGKTHPEYFSLVNGQRLPGTQLCLSNREVLDVLTANLKEKIAAKPHASYWSVSQNDNDQYCHCGPCTELNAKYGGVPSGSILYFVNDVAKAFPEKTISTLAYWYSRTPPQNIQAQPNVNIMLCNIESRRQGPVFETDPKFSNDLIAWGKISGNILIWDYNIQFSNLVSPFPNLHTLKPNIKFYTDHNVNSLFMQANGQAGGEFSGLRAYLICKLMWDPNADDSALIDEYLSGYYGQAAPYIRQYIDRMRESLLSSGFKLNIFGSPEDAKDAYLSAAMMKTYNALFDQAEKAAAKSPQMLTRVKIARLPIKYATIQIGRNEDADTPRSMFAHTSDGKVFVKPEMKALVTEFVSGCKQDGVTKVRERTTTPDDYQASYDRVFTKVAETQHARSFGKKIAPVTLPEGGAANAQRLTDGIFGSWESWSAPDVNWVAYKGQHMDFVLDMGEVTDIGSVNMDFLNAQAQPDWNLLVLPAYVSYSTSTDGSAFGNEVRVSNPNNPNPKEDPGIANIPVQSFRADLNTRARYIKVHGESILHMPSWHIRAGSPAWIYTDQIVVA